MFIVFNILVVLFIGLIAYWWANQGLFSALLHLLCVIAAAAITLGLWEPLTTNLLLRAVWFDDYAWGVSFVVLFAATLLALRVACDKIVGANVDLPPWANLVFGFPVGAAAGIITIGMFLIGAGYIQSTNNIMGFVGHARSDQTGRVEEDDAKLWVPAHEWTYEFFALLSVGSLESGQPLRHYNPDLHAQAASLLRDSFRDGKGKMALRPKDARVSNYVWSEPDNRYLVTMQFEAPARDFGEQLTLSRSQVRLIAEASGFNEAKYAFPDRFTQYSGHHLFDDVSHYASSEPGQAGAAVTFEFSGRDLGGARPRYIQVRNTRYLLPQPKRITPGEMTALRGGAQIAGATAISLDRTAPNIQSMVELSNSIRPINISTNQLPAGIEVVDRYISSGDAEFHRGGGDRPARSLLVRGILEPAGTRIVQVDVSRGRAADIFGRVRERAGENAEIVLVDRDGRPYFPIGYIHERPDMKTRIKLDTVRFMSKFSDLPSLPSAGTHTLKLLFQVTENAVVEGLKMGEVTVGTCTLVVTPNTGSS